MNLHKSLCEPNGSGEGRRIARLSAPPLSGQSLQGFPSLTRRKLPSGLPHIARTAIGGLPRYEPVLHHPLRDGGASQYLPDKEFRSVYLSRFRESRTLPWPAPVHRRHDASDTLKSLWSKVLTSLH